MKFSQLKKGCVISRVEDCKVECAKVIGVDKLESEEYKIVVKGIETKKKYSFKVSGNNCTAVGYNNNERYYADGSIASALRDGIEIGYAAAMRKMKDSIESASGEPLKPYFTVGGRPIKD